MDAVKGLKFERLPYLLSLQLKRFDFDHNTLQRIKLNDEVRPSPRRSGPWKAFFLPCRSDGRSVGVGRVWIGWSVTSPSPVKLQKPVGGGVDCGVVLLVKR